MYIKPHVFPYFLQPWWVSKCKVERVSSPFCWHFSPTTRCFNQKNPTNKNPLKVLKAVKRVSLRKNILGEFFQATPETTIFLKDWPVADKSLKQSQGGLGPVNQGQQGGLVGRPIIFGVYVAFFGGSSPLRAHSLLTEHDKSGWLPG